MDALLETRQRYTRLLDALGKEDALDCALRAEIETAIETLDGKIARQLDPTEVPRICVR